MLKLKRVYDPISRADGDRFLVERLWPRGITRKKLHVAAWLKEAGPSTELRKWFNHDSDKWLRVLPFANLPRDGRSFQFASEAFHGEWRTRA